MFFFFLFLSFCFSIFRLLLVWKVVEDFQKKSEVDRLVVVNYFFLTRRGGFERESLDHLEEFGSAIGSTDMSSRLLFLLIARLLDKF